MELQKHYMGNGASEGYIQVLSREWLKTETLFEFTVLPMTDAPNFHDKEIVNILS